MQLSPVRIDTDLVDHHLVSDFSTFAGHVKVLRWFFPRWLHEGLAQILADEIVLEDESSWRGGCTWDASRGPHWPLFPEGDGPRCGLCCLQRHAFSSPLLALATRRDVFSELFRLTMATPLFLFSLVNELGSCCHSYFSHVRSRSNSTTGVGDYLTSLNDMVTFMDNTIECDGNNCNYKSLYPRHFRVRTSSESIMDQSEHEMNEALLRRSVVQRSASCSEVYAHHRLQQRLEDSHRVKLRCQDEAMCVRSRENVLRLVETVQKNPSNCTSTEVILAKKALRYRRLLRRAEQADLTDPSFDVAAFLREKRCRTELVLVCCGGQSPP